MGSYIAKELPSCIFQAHFAQMTNALEECSEILATELFFRHLIRSDSFDKVKSPCTHEFTASLKVNTLLVAIKRQIAIGNGERTLRKLCDVMSKHENLQELSKQMIESYGKSIHLLYLFQQHACFFVTTNTTNTFIDFGKILV